MAEGEGRVDMVVVSCWELDRWLCPELGILGSLSSVEYYY